MGEFALPHALRNRQGEIRRVGVELEFGGLSWPVFAATVAVIIMTWWVMSKDISQGVEKICSWCMPALALLIFAFAAFVNFLPGGLQGWAYFLTPDFARLSDITLWRDVFGQLLFSLSLGLGIIVGYLVFGDLPTLHTLVGGAIVIGAGIFIILRERRLGIERKAAKTAAPK